MKKKRKRLALKTAYYGAFLLLIVIPLLLVLFLSMLSLNQQFKRQAIENIERAQENIITELVSDINVMSMRLSHLIYTNNNEIMAYAAGTNEQDISLKYEYEQKLQKAGNLALEPVKDIVSVGFYMKNGKDTYIKNSISRSHEEIQQTEWYQSALAKPNTVCVGSYDTTALNDLYTGGRKDMLILVFALSPDITIDRSRLIEMVSFYQTTGAGDIIKEYNHNYRQGKNKLGITRITDHAGKIIFSTGEEEDFTAQKYTCVRTPVKFNNINWYIESYIKTSELTRDYWGTAGWILFIAVFIFILAGLYSRYFLRSIIEPVEEISSGLRQVEEGNLDVHIGAKGQFEIRSMIHQFNAMVRRLKALIQEYEEQVKSIEKTPEDYLAALAEGVMSPQEVSAESAEFFQEPYAMLGFYASDYPAGENESETAARLEKSFERNPRFTARCVLYKQSARLFFVFYRITESDYISGVTNMIRELQGNAKKEFGITFFACIGRESGGHADFEEAIREIRKNMRLRLLYSNNAVIAPHTKDGETDWILEHAGAYGGLADALFTADEKNLLVEREKLFEEIGNLERKEMERHVLAAILAIGMRFETEHTTFADVFEKQYDYMEKLDRLQDLRSLKLWLTNYFSWIMDYSATKLNVMETDVIVKAKRYITTHFEDTALSLSMVADYVGLNEKYFTNCFTKETGETFSSYVTGLRLQKAKELLKTTTFKVYEIAEMVGYNNAEHFNRMFKKAYGITPAQYRKTM